MELAFNKVLRSPNLYEKDIAIKKNIGALVKGGVVMTFITFAGENYNEEKMKKKTGIIRYPVIWFSFCAQL